VALSKLSTLPMPGAQVSARHWIEIRCGPWWKFRGS
jgi:hypothetical protein